MATLPSLASLADEESTEVRESQSRWMGSIEAEEEQDDDDYIKANLDISLASLQAKERKRISKLKAVMAGVAAGQAVKKRLFTPGMRKHHVPRFSKRRVIPRDRCYNCVTALSCLFTYASALTVLIIYMGSFSTALTEFLSLEEAKCKIAFVDVARSTAGLQGSADPLQGLVECCVDSEPGDTCDVHGYGVCINIALNYTVGGKYASEPIYNPMYYHSYLNDYLAAVTYATPEDIVFALPTKTDQASLNYINSIASTQLLYEPSTTAFRSGYKSYRACSFADCRRVSSVSVNATRDFLIPLFTTGVEFDCFTVSDSVTSSNLGALFGRLSTDPVPSGSQYKPVVLAREFDFWSELQKMSIVIAVLAFLCTCYYFLLCREWWCYFSCDCCLRLQHF
ncbi:hypothetical protein AB1Y20_008197 [Prymnesium parvum]|uniref:Uncharacterized protein n=1 Tax=Prymnesium parvum TaxID=97485 RepID=A0AB34IVX6_PRYPA